MGEDTYSLESRSAVVAACLALLGIAAARGDIRIVRRGAHCEVLVSVTFVDLRLACMCEWCEGAREAVGRWSGGGGGGCGGVS